MLNITKQQLASYLTFLTIGCGSLVIDFVIYYVLTRKLEVHYIPARSISLIVTFLWSYTANRFITFKQSQSKTMATLPKYFVINGVAIALNLGGMKLFVGHYHLPDLLVLVCLTGIISILSYGGHKSWTFRTYESP